MSAEFSTANMWLRLNDILTCARDAVSATAAGPPQRACVVPGEVVWDDCSCGTLYVNWRVVGRSDTFPQSATETSQTNCASGYVTVQVGVTMLRCAAGPNANGDAPTCAELSADAFAMTADMMAIRTALSCCLTTMYEARNIADYALGTTLAIGPGGGCDGSVTEMVIGFLGGGCCG